MYLKGSLQGNQIEGISLIPKRALLDQNKIYIYKDSLISPKTIEVVNIKGNEVQIRGIDENEKVVTSNVNNLYSGQKVAI